MTVPGSRKTRQPPVGSMGANRLKNRCRRPGQVWEGRSLRSPPLPWVHTSAQQRRVGQEHRGAWEMQLLLSRCDGSLAIAEQAKMTPLHILSLPLVALSIQSVRCNDHLPLRYSLLVLFIDMRWVIKCAKGNMRAMATMGFSIAAGVHVP